MPYKFKYLRNRIRLILIVFLIMVTISISGVYCFFSDTTDLSSSTLTTGNINLTQNLYINDVVMDSSSIFIKNNEILNLKVDLINDANSLKVRSRSYIRIALPDGITSSMTSGLYVFPGSIDSTLITSELTSGNLIDAIPATVYQESPLVLQYDVPDSNVIDIDTGTTVTINLKLAYTNNSDASYQGVTFNLYSANTILQFQNSTDNDINILDPPYIAMAFQTNVQDTDIMLDKSNITLNGEYQGEVINATLFPSNTTDRTIVWTSSNPDVASIDQNGVVISLSTGNVVITARTASGNTANCAVTVN